MAETNEGFATRMLVPLDNVKDIAKMLLASAMFPDVKSEAQAFAKILKGRELGFGPVYSLEKIYFFGGKTVLAAEAMGALIKASGRYEYKVLEHDIKKCVIGFLDRGQEVYQSNYSEEDAKTAHLLEKGGDMYKKFPKAMLFARALSQGARIVCPHVIAGAYVPEDFGGFTTVEGEVVLPTEEVSQEPALVGQPVPEDTITDLRKQLWGDDIEKFREWAEPKGYLGPRKTGVPPNKVEEVKEALRELIRASGS